MRVKNKPVKVSKITLVTDIGGSPAEFANDDVNKALKDIDVDSNLDFTANYTSSAFAFKNKINSKIKVKFTGGQTPVKYTLKYNNAVLAGHDMQNISNDGIISLSSANLTTIGNTTGETTKELVLELWDSSHNCTPTGAVPLAKSSFAEVKINTLFDALDDKAPTVVVLPFYWNGEGKDSNNNPLNSLYEGSRANGHVEIASVSGMGNTYSSVSGKVSISGFAYDNIKIDTLEASLPNTAALTVKATRQTDGTWTSDKNMASHGAVLTVETLGADYLGYYVKWRLDWDTEKAGVGIAKSITVSVNDGTNTSAALDGGTSQNATVTRGTPKTAEGAVFANKNPGQFVVFKKGETQYLTRIESVSGNKVTLVDTVPTDADEAFVHGYTANKAKVNINVVPYITGLETGNRTKSGLSKNTIRASNGKYSIIKGSTGGFIQAKGFNLSGASVRLVKESQKANASASTGTGLSIANSTATGFTMDNGLSNSGYIEVFVNGVRAINNINDDTKLYNKEEDTTLLKNKTLTDDRYLRVFDMKQTQISNGYYPEMIMDGDDPVFGLINPAGYNSSYGKTLSFLSQPPLYQTQRIKFNSSSGSIAGEGTQQAQVEYIAGAINWDQFAMAKDASNKYHYISVYNYNGAGMMYAYHSYAETEKSYNSSVGGWGSGGGYTGYRGKFAGESGVNALALDSLAYQTSYSTLERYQYPKIIAKGSSDAAEGASIYIAYYDAVENTATKRGIKFRSFKVGDSLTDGSRNMNGTIKSNFAGCTVSVSGTTTGSSYRIWGGYSNPNNSNGRQNVGEGGSRFFDMGITSDGHVVIVYFDEAAGRLKLKYSNAAVDGSNPTGTVSWIPSGVTFPEYTGTYVSMDIDSHNGIHIAAFDSNDGDLKYFYLPSYGSSNSDLKSMTVDAAFSVGQWTQIKVRNDKPYIAYYNNTEAGQRSAIKLAVAEGKVVNGGIGTVAAGVDAQGFVTGKWDCMTVPTITPAQGGNPKFKKVNLGFDTQGRPVLGYLGDNIEFGKWLDE